MSAVIVVVVPTNLDIGRYTNISFLGAYLNEGILSPALLQEEKPFRPIFNMEDILGPERIAFDMPQRRTKEAERNIPGKLNIEKAIQEEKSGEVQKKQGADELAYSKLKNDDIDGELQERAILYRPEKPFFKNELLRNEGRGASASFSFGVSGDGEVKFLNILASTGDIELDSVFARYLKSWRFEPLAGEENRVETGTVRLSL